MVKEFLSKKHLKNLEEPENDESDLDIEEEFDEQEIEAIEFLNDEEKLNEYTNKIKEEFQRYYTSKGKNPNWLQKMTLTGNIEIPEELDVDDDIKRELIFYNITHKNTIQGILKLKDAHEKLNRPGDFFAEMLKSDDQMLRIRRKLVGEQQRIKKFEEKKQKMQNIKFAKAVIFLTIKKFRRKLQN
jgi:rRNA-processing protein EBP2